MIYNRFFYEVNAFSRKKLISKFTKNEEAFY